MVLMDTEDEIDCAKQQRRLCTVELAEDQDNDDAVDDSHTVDHQADANCNYEHLKGALSRKPPCWW